MTFCWCPATTSEDWKRISGGDDFFWMGSPESEKGRHVNETQHRVRLTKGFWFGKLSVTGRQWKAVTGHSFACWLDLDDAARNISWRDALKFLQQINAEPGAVFALPTEAQWEYACRAGTLTPFNFGKRRYGKTRAACYCVPNAWGICELNRIYQWCSDRFAPYSGDVTDPVGSSDPKADRVMRGGGCWWNAITSDVCRSARRAVSNCSRDRREEIHGLRLVCLSVQSHRLTQKKDPALCFE